MDIFERFISHVSKFVLKKFILTNEPALWNSNKWTVISQHTQQIVSRNDRQLAPHVFWSIETLNKKTDELEINSNFYETVNKITAICMFKKNSWDAYKSLSKRKLFGLRIKKKLSISLHQKNRKSLKVRRKKQNLKISLQSPK